MRSPQRRVRAARRAWGGLTAAVALAVIGALAVTGCSGSTRPAGRASEHLALPGRTPGAGFNAGLAAVAAPSSQAGGTLTLDLAGRPDSLDYQDSGQPFVWDFARLYSMQLLTYRSCPGACGRQLVPDLATGLGIATDHGRTWTYHLRAGVRFQNGQPVTPADVKYGIERSYARLSLPYGPDYFQNLLLDPGYGGPYADPASTLTSVTTPDPATIQFHLAEPFADFNYLAASLLTTPVWPGWDAGRHRGPAFQLDPISTGPYEFRSYQPGHLLVLVRNPFWQQATDPQARQLPARIVVRMGLTQAAVDADVLAGRADADLRGGGLALPVAARVLASASLRANADSALTGVADFAYLNTAVIPDVHCRLAVEYAADRPAVLAAFGGPAAGEVASAVLPPTVAGYQPGSQSGSQPVSGGGALAAARSQLRACGRPGGFSTVLAYPSGGSSSVVARALAVSLARAGIRARLAGFPAARYYAAFAGDPAYVSRRGLGIVLGTWRAAWPDGYAFLDALADGSAIRYGGGNVNIAQIDSPSINALFARGLRGSGPDPAVWTQVGRDVLAEAAILPLVDQKVTLYRSPRLTNVYVDQAYGMYNYAVLGVR